MGRRLTGLVLTILGTVGLAVCLAGIVAVSIGAARLRQANTKLIGQADQLIAQVDRRVGQAGEAVGETRDVVDQLKQALQDSAKRLAAERVSSLAEVEKLEQRLASSMERADGLIEIASSSAEVIEQLLVTFDAIALERNIDASAPSELITTVRSTQETLADVSQRLADLQGRLAAIRERRDADADFAELAKLTLGIVTKVDAVQDRITAFRTRLDKTGRRLAELHDRIRGWLVLAQGLIILLIVWGGAGQYCLLVGGWKMLRGSPSTTGKSPVT